MTSKLINASLLQAVSVGDKDKVKSILKDQRYDLSEYEVLVMAIEHNHKHITNLLLKNTKIGKVRLSEVLSFLVIVKPGWIDVIERLIDVGADVGKQNQVGDTVIHNAYDHVNSHDIIDVLFKRYLEKNTKNLMNSKGISLLHIACTQMNLIVVQKLLDANLSMMNAPDAVSQYTPLHFAMKYKRNEIAKYLILRGADIYKQDRNGSTPLHWALQHLDSVIINVIVSVDMRRENIVNIYGLSHFMAACAGDDVYFVNGYLQSLLDNPNVCMRDLITSKLPNFGGFTGYTPLHFAVKCGRITTVKLLLRYGADCCNVAGEQLTPHLLAQIRGSESIKKLLQTHCNLVNKCRVMRIGEPDFGQWGEEYEKHIVMERAMTFKHLRETRQNLSSILRNNKKLDKCCESEFVSTDFQNLFCTL